MPPLPFSLPSSPFPDFARRLLAWHARHGRHDLPWLQTREPYRVWLSEIMLQQTQVATVLPYYARFLQRFPGLDDLARAPQSEVMALWSGLGYYARARNLHRCAQIIVAQHGGQFPRKAAALHELPGIGRSTANAIAAFCFGARLPILDGNVKRVLCRVFGVAGYPNDAAVAQHLWALAEKQLPPDEVARFLQAQMDLGATLCVRARPRCAACPLAALCVAHRENRVAELPATRRKKPLPQRLGHFLLLCHEQKILLEQRPQYGIWGGLACLPELPAGADAASHAQQLGCRIASEIAALPALIHRFTHFQLTLQALQASACPLPQIQSPRYFWVKEAAVEQAALPAPIRKILRAWANSQAGL